MTMDASAPKGGVTPVSKRVMNLSFLVRQAARRFGGEIGLVWGEATWTWADLDRRIDAMAAALAVRGVGKGDRVLVQSKNTNQLFEIDVRLLPARRGVGADQLPADAHGGRLSRRGQRRDGDDLPQRFCRACGSRARRRARHSVCRFDRCVRFRRRL